MKKLLLAIITLTLSQLTIADWKLVPEQSGVTFLDIQNGEIQESHQFKSLTGVISEDGYAKLSVDVHSVGQIPIHNEQMKKLLAAITDNSIATLVIALNQAEINELSSLPKGGSITEIAEIKLDIDGFSQTILAKVQVIGANRTELIIRSVKPVVIRGQDFQPSADGTKLPSADLSLVVNLTFR